MILTLIAESPIHHGAFSDVDTGNITALRRVPVALPDGRHVPIPHVSGNAMRGLIRRLLMRELLDVCGVTPDALGPRPYQRLYAALVNGGHLDGSEASVDPARVRALRLALPPLSVLGASLYTSLLAGRCEVGMLWPVCRETSDAGLVTEAGEAYAEDLVTEYSHVRHVDRESHDPAVSGVTPMPTTIEVLIPGTRLECRIVTRRCTTIEASALAHAAEQIGTVGAKASAGLGRVRVQVEGADGALYREWLAEHRDATHAALIALAEQIGAEKAPKKGKAARVTEQLSATE